MGKEGRDRSREVGCKGWLEKEQQEKHKRGNESQVRGTRQQIDGMSERKWRVDERAESCSGQIKKEIAKHVPITG